jgi:hypothetical protein
VALCALVFLSACPGGGGSDAGPDAGDDAGDATPVPIESELGIADDGFAELPEDPTLEVVSGFQGGFHIEPALRIAEPSVEEFITVVEYTVTDVDSGEVLSVDSFSYRVRHRAWNHEPGVGYTRSWEQVILDVVDGDEAAGRTVRVDVRVEVEETHAVGSASAEYNLVNEIDELR